MKRSPVKIEVFHHYTVFKWVKCNKCGLEFRRERGWVAKVRLPTHRVSGCVYVCGECCGGLSEAEEYFNQIGKGFPPKPPPPPAPPAKLNR